MPSLCFFCFREIKDLDSYIKCQSCPLTLHKNCHKINEYLSICCPIKSKENLIQNKVKHNNQLYLLSTETFDFLSEKCENFKFFK